jgi:hypothetical protein
MKRCVLNKKTGRLIMSGNIIFVLNVTSRILPKMKSVSNENYLK